MLLDMNSNQRITTKPYPELMEIIESRLSSEELEEIYDALNAKIEGTEIQTSSWIPGSDWSNTAFEPIYSKGAQKNEDLAAKLFGLIVWDVFQRREECWYTGRFELDGKPISGRTYFRPQN